VIGYRNMGKGKERLRAIRRAERKGLWGIRNHQKQIAAALQVDLETVQQAIEGSWAIIRERAHQEYVASFVPHAILKTERQRPSQIAICAMTGGDRRWRWRDFEDGSSPITYPEQVLRDLPERVPFFGAVLGFYVNYTPDHCVEFDRDGNPVDDHDGAARIGVSSAGGLERLFT
jgi:hypothetical protein